MATVYGIDKTLFSNMWEHGWYPVITEIDGCRMSIACYIYMRDFDAETGVKDIITLTTEECVRGHFVCGSKMVEMYISPEIDWATPCCAFCGGSPSTEVAQGHPCPTGCGNRLPATIRIAAKFYGEFKLKLCGVADLMSSEPPSGFKAMASGTQMTAAIMATLLADMFPEIACALEEDEEDLPELNMEDFELPRYSLIDAEDAHLGF